MLPTGYRSDQGPLDNERPRLNRYVISKPTYASTVKRIVSKVVSDDGRTAMWHSMDLKASIK